jgi:hypothetical protein
MAKSAICSLDVQDARTNKATKTKQGRDVIFLFMKIKRLSVLMLLSP